MGAARATESLGEYLDQSTCHACSEPLLVTTAGLVHITAMVGQIELIRLWCVKFTTAAAHTCREAWVCLGMSRAASKPQLAHHLNILLHTCHDRQDLPRPSVASRRPTQALLMNNALTVCFAGWQRVEAPALLQLLVTSLADNNAHVNASVLRNRAEQAQQSVIQ